MISHQSSAERSSLSTRGVNDCHSLLDHRRELAFSTLTMRSMRPCQWRWGCCHGNCVFSAAGNAVSSYWLRLLEPHITVTTTTPGSDRRVAGEHKKHKSKNISVFWSLSPHLPTVDFQALYVPSCFTHCSCNGNTVKDQWDVWETSTHSYISGEARVGVSVCLFMDQSKCATWAVRLTCFLVYMRSWTELRHQSVGFLSETYFWKHSTGVHLTFSKSAKYSGLLVK